MHSAQDASLIDTANSYGGDLGPGATGKVIGNWFARGGQRRERTVLATKVYGDMSDWPNDAGLSALNIRRALDASLSRLKTDYIDVFQFHHVDRSRPWDEIWQAMETAVAQGKLSMRAAVTSPGGISRTLRQRLSGEISAASSASNPCTTC